MKHYGGLWIALLIAAMALLPAACGYSDSLPGGRTISTDGIVQGLITSHGTTVLIPPGTETISNALSSALDKDKFLLMKGTYFDNVAIDRSLSITGAGKTKTIVDGSFDSHGGTVFTIDPGAVVTLADMTIQNGEAGKGGGIIVDHSKLTVKDCIIKDNAVQDYGGGIYVNGEGGSEGLITASLTLIDSQVSCNHAMYGGGIYNDANPGFGKSTVTLINSQISGNTAINDGGGVYNDGRNNCDLTAILTLTNCKIFGNTAANGAGIYNDGRYGGEAIANIANSQIFENKATASGGGICNNGQGGTAKVTLTNSKISDNTALVNGGGIYNDGASTFDTAILTLKNCKIFGNTAANGGGIYNDGSEGGTAIANIANSQIFENKATASGGVCTGGGGIYNDGRNGGTAEVTLTNSKIFENTGYLGGGIKNLDGTLNVYFSQIYGNKAEQDGGGIYWAGTAPTIKGSLIIMNTPNNIAQAVPG